MTDPIYREIDKHCDLHTFKYWITYEGTVEAHDEEEAAAIVSDTLSDIHDEVEPDIAVQWSWR